MKQYYLQIKSKNEKSLKHFLKFFFKHLKVKSSIFSTSIINQNNKKIITLLKSPHVNKIAQEHFELRKNLKKLLLKSVNLKTNSILLKKVVNSLFHDLAISLKIITNKTIEEKNTINIFYSDNFKIFKINKIKFNKRRYLQKRIAKKFFSTKRLHNSLLKLLNLMSMFGEILTLQLKNSKIV